MEKLALTGYTGQVAQVVLDSLPLATSFVAYSAADSAGKSGYMKAAVAVGAGILVQILKGYVQRNVVSISGLTIERVGALQMPQLRTRTNQRQGYGALTLERVAGCAGCGY